MNAINDFLLGLFTGKDDLRPVMMLPNFKDGVVYATDTHAMIAIPEDELSMKYGTSEKYPNARKILCDMEALNLSSIKASVEGIAKELAKCRIEADKLTIKCNECGGNGMVEWTYEDKNQTSHYADHDCPACGGDGYNEASSLFPRISILQQEDENGNLLKIKIGHLYYHPFQIYKLFMVAIAKGCKEVELFYDKDNCMTMTHFGNIKVFIMASV